MTAHGHVAATQTTLLEYRCRTASPDVPTNAPMLAQDMPAVRALAQELPGAFGSFDRHLGDAVGGCARPSDHLYDDAVGARRECR